MKQPGHGQKCASRNLGGKRQCCFAIGFGQGWSGATHLPAHCGLMGLLIVMCGMGAAPMMSPGCSGTSFPSQGPCKRASRWREE